MPFFRVLAPICIIFSLLHSSAYAQEELLELTAQESNTPTLAMVTGSKTGTYYRFGQEIAEALAEDDLLIDIKESTGSIANIKRISSNENATFGIVQSDVLGFLQRSTQAESQAIADKLRLVFPFYNEEVHILARKNIQNVTDLQGKVIAFGPKGSGSWLTALNLLNLTNTKPAKLLRLSSEEALVSVLRGEADAMVFVAGKPVRLFENLESLDKNEDYTELLSNVHFVPLQDMRILKEYSEAFISPQDYSFIKETVPTVAVTAILVSHENSDVNDEMAKQRCDDMRRFSEAMVKHLDALRATGHAKWKEVDLQAEVGVWKRDSCSIFSDGALEEDLFNTLQFGE